MKKLKRLLSFVLTLVIAFSVLSVCVVPASAAEAGTLVSNAISLSNGSWYTKYWTKSNYNLKCYNKIYVPSNGYITFTAAKPYDSEGEIGTYTLKLYNPDGSIIWEADTSSQKNNMFNEYYIYKIGLAAGTYYLDIDPHFSVYSGSIKSQYKYDFKASNYWEIESNNDQLSATTMTVGQTYYGVGAETYYDYGDDYYKVYLKKGEVCRLTIGNHVKLDDEASYYLYYPGGDYDSLTSYNGFTTSGTSGYYNFDVPYTGWYYLEISCSSNNVGINYTVKFSKITRKSQTIGGPSTITRYGYTDFNLKDYGVTAKTELSYAENSDVINMYSYDGGKVYANKSGTAVITVSAKQNFTYKAATKKITVKIYPKNPTLNSVTNTNKGGLIVKYDNPSEGGDKIQIQIATNSKFTKNVKNYSFKDSYDAEKTLSGLKVNQKYYIRVRGYDTVSGKNYYSKWSKTFSKTVTVKSPKVSVSKTESSDPSKFKVTWKEKDGVSGYEVQIATDSKFKKNKKAKKFSDKKYYSENSYEFTGLVPGKKYYARVRSYIKVGGKYYYSSWSSVKSKTVKSVPKVTGVSAYSWSKGKLETDWYSASGVAGYEVQVATNSKFTKNKKTKTINGNDYYDTEYEFSGLKAGVKYYTRVRAFVKVGSKKYYGSWSSVRNKTIYNY